MSPIINPCYKCEDREVGCHSNCEKYKEFAKKRKSIGDLKRSQFDATGYDADKDLKRRKQWHR